MSLFIPKDLMGRGLIAEPTPREIDNYGNGGGPVRAARNYIRGGLAPYVLGLSMIALPSAACGDSGPAGHTPVPDTSGQTTGDPVPGPTPSPTPPVEGCKDGSWCGRLYSRMTGEPIQGARVSARSLSGPSAHSESVDPSTDVDGSFVVPGVGFDQEYLIEVTKEGELVPHVTERARIPGHTDLSVLRYGDERNGVVFDRLFERFFNDYARMSVSNGRTVTKVDPARPFTEIYVVEGGLPQKQFDELIGYLEAISERNTSDYLCDPGAIPPVVKVGRPVNGNRKDGSIVVTIGDGASARPWLDPNGYIVSCHLTLDRNYFGSSNSDDTPGKLHVAAHELGHCHGAGHVEPDMSEPRLMATGGLLSDELSEPEKGAACLMNHGDTWTGNVAPDRNRHGVRFQN